MSSPISPWSDSADRISPDGRFRAVIKQAYEIAMSAPTCGTLVISDNRRGGRIRARLNSCSPSFVWSSDSKALAVPRWTRTKQQRLWIVSLPRGTVRRVAEQFCVLELHAFGPNIVRGIDSPIHLPRNFELSVEDLIEHDPPTA